MKHKLRPIVSHMECNRKVWHNCGHGPNISYPVWIFEEQESFCGYLNFEITCKEKDPTLKISEETCIIKNIFYNNNSLLVVNAVVQDDCPTPQRNVCLDQTPFSLSPDNVNLSFLYNCEEQPNYHTYPTNYSIKWCRTMIDSPIFINDDVSFVSLLDMNFTKVLKSEFVLNWTAHSCSSCKRSGGRCRFCAGAGGVLITSLFFYCWLRHRRGKGFFKSSFITGKSYLDRSLASDYEKGDSFACVHVFTYKELEEATNNFDSNRELGDGGFGTVYYGKLRDSRTVAVKRLYENNYRRVEQFMNEVDILTRLRHPNLVSLYGCTSRHSRELLVVYEYVENGTVADHLHGEYAKPGALPWHIRLDIAIETASALKYLHASDIIHRDVKTNNILLDNYFHVKVGDFGLSRLFPTDVTHVSTAPQGTPGYVDPEYHQCYQLTSKSDVFSFGVVLTELISSKPAVDIMRHRHEINLWNMAINKIQNRALHELVDPSLEFETDEKVRKKITLVAEVAFQCLQNEKDMRPTMAQVFEALVGIQNEEYKKEKGEEIEMEAAGDEGGLLKSTAVPHSPDSVIKWVSNGSSSTTTTTPSF
ncbi:hypothetical protein V6Z11_A09G203600 [Gossypium hirsutum]